MEAGIKIWVLTGDKQETAIEIGKSCNLIIEDQMDIIILSSKTKKEFEEKLKRNSEKVRTRKMCLVIDGSTLTHALEDKELSYSFFKFGFHANSVICCRVSPK